MDRAHSNGFLRFLLGCKAAFLFSLVSACSLQRSVWNPRCPRRNSEQCVPVFSFRPGDAGRARPTEQRSTGGGMRHPNDLTPAWQETTPRGVLPLGCPWARLIRRPGQALPLRSLDFEGSGAVVSRAAGAVSLRPLPPPLAFSAETFHLGRQSKSRDCGAEGRAQPGLSEPQSPREGRTLLSLLLRFGVGRVCVGTRTSSTSVMSSRAVTENTWLLDKVVQTHRRFHSR